VKKDVPDFGNVEKDGWWIWNKTNLYRI